MKNLFARFLAFLRAYAEQRDERLWSEWEALLQARERNGGKIFEITRLRQHARTGTKAYGAEPDSRTVDPIWAEGVQLRVGTYILATDCFRRGTRDGSHHDENFWHVRNIVRTTDRRAFTGWHRHNQRQRLAGR